MAMTHRWPGTVWLVGLVLMATPATPTAQEQSVKPGINDSFVDPDVDSLLSRMERPDRVIYKYRHAIVAALGLEPGMEAADVGSGTGFLALLMAREVGPDGKVYAEDIAQETLDFVARRAAEESLANVETVLGTHRSTNLKAASVDLLLACDAYHHFEYPEDMLASIHQALRPDGRFVVIDFERVEGVTEDFFLEHVRAGKGTFTDEVRDAGFEPEKEIPLMKGQYFLVFRKR
jgi:ubiquinone/menaquinone biosynthesis C-methylase UbiE